MGGTGRASIRGEMPGPLLCAADHGEDAGALACERDRIEVGLEVFGGLQESGLG